MIGGNIDELSFRNIFSIQDDEVKTCRKNEQSE
jgi:hypothetical protein